MTHATEPDLGALTWVKGEIDAALERARAALEQGSAENDGGGLQFAQTHLHQVRGALAIVGLDGLTRFADAAELLLGAMAREAVPATPALRGLVRRALAMMGNYLDELAHGAPDQPLRLADTYLELAAAAGQADAAPVDLFHPDLGRRPPPPTPDARSGEEADKALRSARSRFERGLLEWLRKGSAGEGAQLMRDAIAEVDAVQGTAAARSLWWTSLAFYDALIDGSLAPEPAVKRLCTQIDAQFRRLLSGAATAPERLQRELLYRIAHCPAHTAQQQAVRACYGLDALLPAAEATVSGTPTAPLLETLNRQLAAARAHWDDFCAGTAVELQRFEEAVEAMLPPAEALGRPGALRLAGALQAFAHWLRKDPLQFPDAAAMEVATALLTLETALAPRPPQPSLTARADSLAARLEALTRGETLDEDLCDAALAAGAQAQEKAAIEQLVREMRSSLAQIEQVLDDFFRDQGKREPLRRLHAPLQQIVGALSVLGETVALDLLRNAAARIASMASADSTAGQPEFEALASQLSALGFYLDALPHGGADLGALLAQQPDVQRAPSSAERHAEQVAEPQPEETVPPEAEPAAAAPTAPPTTPPAEATLPDGDAAVAATDALPRAEADAFAPLAPVGGAPGLDAFAEFLPLAPADEALVGELDFDLAAAPVPALDGAPAAEPPAAAAAAAQPVADEQSPVDAELLGIFIEEAQEVLATLHEQLERLRTAPTDPDALRTIRRGFHTLKGSGRMVGLASLGEAAWAVEQTLNRWLQLEWPVTPALLHFADSAQALFAQWVARLQAGDLSAIDAATVVATADRLRAADTPPFAPVRDEARDEAALPPIPAPEPEAPAALPPPETAMVLESAEFLFDDDLAGLPRAEEAPLEDLAETFGEDIGTPADEAQPEPTTAADTEAGPRDEAEALLEFIEPLEDEEDLAEAFPAWPEQLAPLTEPLPQHEPAAPVPADAAAPIPTAAPAAAPRSGDTLRIGDAEISRALHSLYCSEAAQHLDTLADELRALRDGAPRPPTMEALRAVHTLAGISGTAHLDAPHRLGRALEHALERLIEREQAPGEKALVLFAESHAALRAMLDEAIAERAPQAAPALIEALDDLAGTQLPSGAPDVVARALAEPAAPLAPPPADTNRSPAQPMPAEAEAGPAPVDDIDAKLLPIFLEEAAEVLGRIHDTLRSWRQADDGDDETPRALARLLHSLKGSARMAGAMTLGAQLHQLESRLEDGLATHEPVDTLADAITLGIDHCEQIIDTLALGEGGVTGAPSATAEAPGTESAAETETFASPTLRVRAERIDRFVNQSGEIGVARSRVEGELRTMRRSLLELTENVIRLRNQLREVEIQAEVQMQSRIAHAGAQQGDFDPLELDRYTRLQELTRMMAESVNDVTTVQQNLLHNLDGAELALNGQARMARDLQEGLMQVRMLPFDSLASRLYRVVRQSAHELGKRASLDLRGGRTPVDRSVLEQIAAPLEHLLRNALAHGIETPEARVAAGKPETGNIVLDVTQAGNEIAIEVADDGAGLDLARIAEHARARGLLAADEHADERRLSNLIFVSGFSTARALSAVSGRGVGMDVVKAQAAAIGGRVTVSSTPGEGARFTLHIPITLAVTRALLVQAGGRTWAIPSSLVAQAMELKPDALRTLQDEHGMQWQGQHFPYRYLPRLLGDRETHPEEQRYNWVLLLRSGGQALALHVDGLRGNQDIMVKNAGPQLTRVAGMSGATILGDGEIVLILNPLALAARGADEDAGDAAHLPPEAEAPPPLHLPTVMVVDDSLTVRKITGRLLEREGYRVLTAKDGVDALEQLIDTLPDIVLSDIEMPRMDGFDLVRNIRADKRLQHLPVVMITSRLAEKHRRYAEEVGANHYLGKPYQEEELLGLVAAYTQGAARSPH